MSLRLIEKTLTVQASAAYTDGDQLNDAAVELTNVFKQPEGVVLLRSIVLLDKAKQAPEVDILFFDEEPTVASTINNALDITDAEMADKFLGHVKLAAANYEDIDGCSFATKSAIDLLLGGRKEQSNNPTGKSLWFIAVTRGTPTFASTSDVILRFGFER